MLQSHPKLLNVKSSNGGPYDGWPLLTIAASNGHNGIMALLIKSGADVNETNLSSETPLHYAAAHGHGACVQLLLDHKANPNLKSDSGATPLSTALAGNHTATADILRNAGAKE